MRKSSVLLGFLAFLLGSVRAFAEKPDSKEIIVFAAASLEETMTEIAENYRKAQPEVTILYNFDSSGTLKTQIEEGADCDIFISASPKQMNELQDSEPCLILPETRLDLLENKVVLAVPEENPAGLSSFDDLADRLKNEEIFLSMGNADVPVGQYTRKILTFYGLKEDDLAAAGKITYGTNVKEIATHISEAITDCGVIYRTDAFSAHLITLDEADPEMCGQVIYPAAVLAGSVHPDAAKTFLEYLSGEEASVIFESVGFKALSGK